MKSLNNGLTLYPTRLEIHYIIGHILNYSVIFQLLKFSMEIVPKEFMIPVMIY
jgi:hypothetical protein